MGFPIPYKEWASPFLICKYLTLFQQLNSSFLVKIPLNDNVVVKDENLPPMKVRVSIVTELMVLDGRVCSRNQIFAAAPSRCC